MRPNPEQRRLLRKFKRHQAATKAAIIASNCDNMTQAARSDVKSVNPARSMTTCRYVGGWARIERGSLPHNGGGH